MSVAPIHRPDAQTAATDRDLLRVATCGSVDDGKSTLIGRLLFDAGLVAEDHLQALARDSKGRPAGPEGYDFSLLVDGLMAEREQGITIDVAYRYFSTPRRTFIVADSPGHEQYTRNMATAASNADVALILIDARQGILEQTRRHLTILGLFGIGHVAAAINKMDLVGWDEGRFRAIEAELAALASQVGVAALSTIPLSARDGDNVVRRSPQTPWHSGPTLLEWLEAAPAARDRANQPFRFPVQWVNRPDPDFRGFAGTVASGMVKPGDAVEVVGSSARRTRVVRLVTMDGDLMEAHAGDAVTITLEDEVDVARGDVLASSPQAGVAFGDQFAADLIWFDEAAMLPGRSYVARIGTAFVPATVTELKHRLNVSTQERAAAKVLHANDIGLCNVALDRPVAFEAYRDNPALGAFILIDRATSATVGAGMIRFALRRSGNIAWQAFDTTRGERASLLRQKPVIVWMTGYSGSGKSTLANLAERMLTNEGHHTVILDGDNLRHGLNRDLGFTEADRVENLRRTAEVARLMAEAGLIVFVSLISPFRRERERAREIAGPVSFLEVFVDAPLALCESRDPKGLYRKARAGTIRNFTGIDSAYEPPAAPDLRLDTAGEAPEALARRLRDAIAALALGEGANG